MSKLLSSATATIAAATLLSPDPATGVAGADEIGPYLGWTDQIGGDCRDTSLNEPAGEIVLDDPVTRSSGLLFDRETRTETGTLKDKQFIENGVVRAARFKGCDGWHFVHRYSPLAYKHRVITQPWICNGGGCQPLPYIYGDWADGTRFPAS